VATKFGLVSHSGGGPVSSKSVRCCLISVANSQQAFWVGAQVWAVVRVQSAPGRWLLRNVNEDAAAGAGVDVVVSVGDSSSATPATAATSWTAVRPPAGYANSTVPKPHTSSRGWSSAAVTRCCVTRHPKRTRGLPTR
jgi:hypothetical protein